MKLVAALERAQLARQTLQGSKPLGTLNWDTYFPLLELLGETHAAALALAIGADEQGLAYRRFSTDIPQCVLDEIKANATQVLGQLDEDIRRAIVLNGPGAIESIRALSVFREVVLETIRHYYYLVGKS